MARRPRVHYPGALYHVILRGNARQEVFFEDGDRHRFCLLLQEGLGRYDHRIHAFCLMTNHIHLALQSGQIPLSRFMQNLGFRYTRWINWRLKRSGHLFQGRFKAVLVDADSYLLQLVRYIHLNPVRAGLVKNADEHRWSSHKAYCGRELIPWLTTEAVWSRLSASRAQAISAYKEFLLDGMKEGHRAEFHKGMGEDCRLLGNDEFVEKALRQAQDQFKERRLLTVQRIIDQLCCVYRVEKAELQRAGRDRLLTEVRGMAAWLVVETGCGTLAELGRETGRDVSTLSSAARRLQLRARDDTKLESLRESLLQRLIVK
jgi:putative transposase